jgi:hypothetical protein
MVKNEQDIIEAFVRHNLRFLNHLVIVDNGSVDDTRRILALLSAEFSNLLVIEDDRFGYDQSKRMTAWLHQYQAMFSADYVFALDADEFLDVHQELPFYAMLCQIPQGGFGLIPWCTYVITPGDAESEETDCLQRMNYRRRQELPGRYKVVLRLDRGTASDLILAQGNHSISSNSGRNIAGIRIEGLRILHYPVRSIDQVTAKSIVGWMAYLAEDPRAAESKCGDQWRSNFEELTCGQPLNHQALCERSILYTQDPRRIDWNKDVVYEPSRLVYERKYSSGASLPATQLVARSWEHSVTGTRRHSPSVIIADLVRDYEHVNRPTTDTPLPPCAIPVQAIVNPLEQLLLEGRATEALQLLETSLVKKETAELWSDWATVQCSCGDATKAEQGYRRALQLDRFHRGAAVNLGFLFLSRGMLQEGVALLEQHAATLTDAERKAIIDMAEPFLQSAQKPARLKSPLLPHAIDTDAERQARRRKGQRKYLVVVRAGDSSLHPTWLQGDVERNWDLIVHSFGKECPWQNEEGVEIIRATGDDVFGPKMRAMHSLYDKRKNEFLSYDFVCFPDDDLAMSLETMNMLFTMCDHFGLDFAQPALTHDSYMASWGITMENSSFLLRYTNFVEIMIPVFSRAHLQRCAPTFNENVSGYGLDILWSSWVESPWKIGILDACPVRHTRAAFSGQLYKAFAERGVSPDQELIALIKKWHLVSEKDQIPGQVVVPSSLNHGGVLKDQTRVTIAEGQGLDMLRALLNGFPKELTVDPMKVVGFLHPVMAETLNRSSHGSADPDRAFATRN